MTQQRTETAPSGTAVPAAQVTVVVVTYNSATLLPDLIASLPAAMGGLAWRLVVADNASSDDSVGVVRRLLPAATVVETGRNAGYGAGINAAVAALGGLRGAGESVLVLNPDVRLGPECVATLHEVLGDDVGIAVPRLGDRHGRLIESMRREPTLPRALADAALGARRAGRYPWLGEVVTDPRCYETDADTDWAEGSVQLISGACWASCAPWDESFFLYSEETDFGLRARDAGLRTRFVAGARATHLEGDSGHSTTLWPLVVVNRLRLYRRRHGFIRAVPFWAALLLRELSRSALGIASSRAAARTLVDVRRMRAPAGPQWLR